MRRIRHYPSVTTTNDQMAAASAAGASLQEHNETSYKNAVARCSCQDDCHFKKFMIFPSGSELPKCCVAHRAPAPEAKAKENGWSDSGWYKNGSKTGSVNPKKRPKGISLLLLSSAGMERFKTAHARIAAVVRKKYPAFQCEFSCKILARVRTCQLAHHVSSLRMLQSRQRRNHALGRVFT